MSAATTEAAAGTFRLQSCVTPTTAKPPHDIPRQRTRGVGVPPNVFARVHERELAANCRVYSDAERAASNPGRARCPLKFRRRRS